MVELRKRKEAPTAPAPVAKKKSTTSIKKAATEKKVDAKPKEETKVLVNGDTPKSTSVSVGGTIDLDGFGGEFELQDGTKTSLKELVEKSKSGVVLFTYPKANTPGCTVQACSFRDGHTTLTGGGLEIYGLSGDSPKSNTTFKTKHSLPYSLICNPSYSLIGAIGMQQGTAHKTKRGVFAVDKKGKVLLSFAGGPIPTVDAAKKLVDSLK